MDKLTIKKWDDNINENQMEALCEVYDSLCKLRAEEGNHVFFPQDPSDKLPFMLSIIKKEIDILIKRYVETNKDNGNKERVHFYFDNKMDLRKAFSELDNSLPDHLFDEGKSHDEGLLELINNVWKQIDKIEGVKS
tara:strand:+ start:253 stop:660 length:408 start_codon:yes stop_codon:yes gene_type:complete